MFAAADPTRFKPYHEPLRVTLRRTVLIAVGLGTIGMFVQTRRSPTASRDLYTWGVLVFSTLWISLGGHLVELFYLNVLRPRIARAPDWLLVFARVAVWLLGGAVLFCGMATTYHVLLFESQPGGALIRSAVYGGPAFVGIELVPHTILALLGRPSFWNRRG